METGTTNTGAENGNATPTTPVFTEEQQKFIEENIIDKRFAKITAKHEAELARVKKERDDAKAAADAAATSNNGNNGQPNKEAEEAQYKAILAQEKAEKEAALETARKAQERERAANDSMKSMQKTQAIRDAAAAMAREDGVEFHDMPVVEGLVGKDVVWDSDAETWVVKENGVVKKNASLMPMSLQEYLKGFAAERPYFVRGTTKSGAGSTEGSRQGSNNGVSVVRSKADLKTVPEKSDYITKFGYEAWEKLPTRL